MNESLLEKSLKMPPNERVAFAETILASIDHENDEIRQEWISEVKRRMRSVEEENSKLLDFEKILNED